VHNENLHHIFFQSLNHYVIHTFHRLKDFYLMVVIECKIKYTDFDFLSSSVIDKDSNNDITLMLTTMPPSNVRKSFYIKGANKGFIFPNDYPAGGLVIDDASTILAYEPSGWARFSNQGEFQASDGFDFYFLYMLDLFRLYEKNNASISRDFVPTNGIK